MMSWKKLMKETSKFSGTFQGTFSLDSVVQRSKT